MRALTDLLVAGPTRGIRHAFGRNCYLSLLHNVDSVDGKALRLTWRLRAPAVWR